VVSEQVIMVAIDKRRPNISSTRSDASSLGDLWIGLVVRGLVDRLLEQTVGDLSGLGHPTVRRALLPRRKGVADNPQQHFTPAKASGQGLSTDASSC
jgi:hypothetical protein